MKYYLFLQNPATWFIGLCGLLIGSFLNVCIYRIPLGTFFASARSQCPHCAYPIAYYDNLPLVSFVWLRARCRHCRERISCQYPLIEAVTAILFIFSFYKFPFFVDLRHIAETFYKPDFFRFMHFIVLYSILLTCSAIDRTHMIIPDVISLPMIILGPLTACVHPELRLYSSVMGILWGGGVIYGIAWAYYLLRKAEGIGMGDAKLLAFIGGWLGYESVCPTLLWGSLLGTCYGLCVKVLLRQGSWRSEMPFGPFLALGAFLYGSQWLDMPSLLGLLYR